MKAPILHRLCRFMADLLGFYSIGFRQSHPASLNPFFETGLAGCQNTTLPLVAKDPKRRLKPEIPTVPIPGSKKEGRNPEIPINPKSL